MKILFTSVGRRVELIQEFKNAANQLNVKLDIFGADISDTAPALFFCDKTFMVSKTASPNYIDELLTICNDNKIDALIPTIDYDLLLLAKNKDKFLAIGTKVFVSSPDKVKICRDKRHTSQFFLDCGLNAPTPVDKVENYKNSYPAFIKPIDGSSSVNAFKVESYDDLCSKAAQIPQYIIQPFIDGKEYTIDIFCDYDGNTIFITPRERLVVRAGEVLKTKITQDEKIINDCKKIIEKFKPCGAITVQMIRDKVTNNDYYIEINPRYGGGAPLSIKAGANSPMALINILNGVKEKYYSNAAQNNLIYSRFDQSICVNKNLENDNINLKAIIFDLDDTLYSEKDYVISGFKAVANVIPEVKNAEAKLYEAFIKKLPAIDTVLKNENLLNKKEECLSAYRNNFPNIEFRNGIIQILKKLKLKDVYIGVITDGRVEGQRNKINALNLNKYIDSIIITDELGGEQFRKPCDIAFRIMQLRSNVPFENMVYIGDNLSKDFIAPEKLGMQCIMLEHDDNLYKFSSDKILTFKNINQLNDYFEKHIG